MSDRYSMFSPIVARTLDSFREVEHLKKDFFSSTHVIVHNDDSAEYLEFLRSQRWWMELKSWTNKIELYFYTNWQIPSHFLRFANELFVEDADLKELQVIWDTSIRRYYLKKSGCTVTTDDNQMPILYLFKEEPEKAPNGLWGVCKRPIDLDNPYAYYGVSLYKKLGSVIEEVSDGSVFI